MNCKRSAVGAVALGNHLYVCGGFDGISSLDTVERWAYGVFMHVWRPCYNPTAWCVLCMGVPVASLR